MKVIIFEKLLMKPLNFTFILIINQKELPSCFPACARKFKPKLVFPLRDNLQTI